MTGGNLIQDNPWPDDAVTKLVRLWEDGFSAGQIGKIMSRTRNAVIGKVHRLGLERRGETKHRMAPRNVKPRAKRLFNPSIPRSVRPFVARERMETAMTLPPLNGNGVTLLDLKRDQCHAVILIPPRSSKELPRYCGNPSYAGTPYCEGHFFEYHRPNLKAG